MSNELLNTGHSASGYYKSINGVYEEAFGQTLMLHYPYFLKEGESLQERQANLSNYCFSFISNWDNKIVLEVGCGNGVQSLFLANNYPVSRVYGIDLNHDNLLYAERLEVNNSRVQFNLDNAQELNTVKDNSVDIVICIESAFHYSDKLKFLEQVNRVLKPGGEFVIADILNRRRKIVVLMRWWGVRMVLHHWIEREYLEGIEKASLLLNKKEDITATVIRGYKGFGRWIKRDNFKKIGRYRYIKIFTAIQCTIYIIFLRFRRRYIVFYGKKKVHSL